MNTLLADPARVLETSTTWGTTTDERRAHFACDDHLPDPDVVWFRGIDVHAPADAIWPWLCQMKVAPYSYDWLDNFGRQSPRELIPGLEQLEVGQRFVAIFTLVDFDDGNELTIKGEHVLSGAAAITYRIVPCDDERSRIVVKMLLRFPPGPLGSLLRRATSTDVGDRIASALELVMMEKQLRTFRELAERMALSRSGS